MNDREKERARLRAEFPLVAEFTDQLRAALDQQVPGSGAGVRIRELNGRVNKSLPPLSAEAEEWFRR